MCIRDRHKGVRVRLLDGFLQTNSLFLILRRQDNRLVGVFIQAFRMVDGRSSMEGDGNKVVNLLRFVGNDGKGLVGVHVLQEKVNRKGTNHQTHNRE